MKKQLNPVPDWRNPNFIYRPSVATDILKTMRRFGFIPPSEKREKKNEQ
jgi:hypothetical protein